MEAFRSALEYNDLVDFGWNQKFIWPNRHRDTTYTKETLDRVVANKPWMNLFGNLGTEVLVSYRSDHQPIMLSIEEKYDREANWKRIFKYEAK